MVPIIVYLEQENLPVLITNLLREAQFRYRNFYFL